jgi:hypothetical protein
VGPKKKNKKKHGLVERWWRGGGKVKIANQKQISKQTNKQKRTKRAKKPTKNNWPRCKRTTKEQQQ